MTPTKKKNTNHSGASDEPKLLGGRSRRKPKGHKESIHDIKFPWEKELERNKHRSQHSSNGGEQV